MVLLAEGKGGGNWSYGYLVPRREIRKLTQWITNKPRQRPYCPDFGPYRPCSMAGLCLDARSLPPASESALVDLTHYLPILLFLAVAVGLSALFVFLPMGVSRLTGSHKPDAEKLSEYECGFPAFEEPRDRFDVRFYLVAILFIIFDLEAAFLFPWAVSLDLTGWTGWATMMTFLAELVIGLAYAWKMGALDWE